MERCRSGLTGGPGKTVCRKVPWVRIPPFPNPQNKRLTRRVSRLFLKRSAEFLTL